jgi:hypothetical protein
MQRIWSTKWFVILVVVGATGIADEDLRNMWNQCQEII